MPFDGTDWRRLCVSVKTLILMFVFYGGTRSISAQIPLPMIDEVSFARYTTPWSCARAAQWHTDRFWRDKRFDTVYFRRGGNPPIAEGVDAVRRCVAKFHGAPVAPRDLLGLLQAYLAADDAARADTTAIKLLASVRALPLTVKAWTLFQIVDVYLGASMPRLAEAERYLAQLDALGPPAAAEQMMGHVTLADVAHQQDSVPLWDRELRAASAAGQALTGDAQKEYAYVSAQIALDLANLKARMNDGPRSIRVIKEARATLAPLRPSVGQLLRGMEFQYTAIGRPVSSARATRWFNTHGDSLYPKPGKPTVFVMVSHDCGDRCYPAYAILRRLRAKYAARGLDIILFTRTLGFYRNRLVEPDSEMVLANDYFTNTLMLPVPLAVWRTQFGRRDDGKKAVLSAGIRDDLKESALYLINRQGKIRLAPVLSRDNEAVIEDVIDDMLAK